MRNMPRHAAPGDATAAPDAGVYGGVRRFLLLLVPLALAATAGEYENARRKLDLIEGERLAAGKRVQLTGAELNAYLARELLADLPAGVRQPRLELGAQAATGSALIDFGKLRRAQGKAPGWLLGRLIDGERPVRVTAAIRSSGGAATVDVESVEISGVVLDGKALDFLIEHFLLPQYPTAAIGRPFELGHRIDRLEVRPNAVTVVIGR